jgi:hypothetical protein
LSALAKGFQASNRVSNGAAADLKQLRQFAFGGQFVAGFQFFQNQTFDLLGDFFVDFVSADGLEIGFDRCGHKQVVR